MKRFLKYDTEIVKKENSPVDKMGVIKDQPLAYEYMPEGYPRKETTMQEVVILDNATIGSTFIGGGMYQTTSDKPVEIFPIVGNTYTLNCDGVDYEITAVENGNGNAVCDLDASNTPLNTRFVVNNDKTLSGGVAYSAVDEHVVSITGMQEITTIYPMSKEFMHGPSIFVAEFDLSYTNNYTCDKSIDEIIEAAKLGYVVFAKIQGSTLVSGSSFINHIPLVGYNIDAVHFYGNVSKHERNLHAFDICQCALYYGNDYGIKFKLDQISGNEVFNMDLSK